MYKITEQINSYHGKIEYILVCDGFNMGKISENNIALFKKRNISFDDSKGIEQYLKYNNL